MQAVTAVEGMRAHTEVAVGILIRGDGALLLTSRPAGKVYAGYWEFPGGKLEAGESVEQALRRELQEEIGITIGPVQVWKVTEHDYPHALVPCDSMERCIRDARGAANVLATLASHGAARAARGLAGVGVVGAGTWFGV